MISFSTASSLPELTLRTTQMAANAPAQQHSGDGGFLNMLGQVAAETATAVREGEAATAGSGEREAARRRP